MIIRKAKTDELNKCLEIMVRLTDWFDKDDLVKIKEAIYSLPVYVYFDNDKILGFVCIEDKYNGAVEIEYIGIDVNYRNKGIGTELINYIEKDIARGKVIEAKTIDDSNNYPPYMQTRAFLEKNGFVKVEVINPFPGWIQGRPCAIYIRKPKFSQM